MRITNTSDFPITDGGCKKATGKTLQQWFKELDKIDGLKQGRMASTQHIYASRADPWIVEKFRAWCDSNGGPGIDGAARSAGRGSGSRPSRAADRSVLTCTPMSSASMGNGRSAWSSRCVASAWARAMTWDGVARRPVSHVRYDSGDTPSRAANAACDWPNAIRHSRSVRGSTTSHHAIGTGRRQVRDWCWAYFSQPIVEGDRSLFSPAPSPLVPRQGAQSANSLGKWHARQDSNLRPSA